MAAAFSSSGEDAITRTLEVAPDTLSNGSIEDVYEVRRTVKDIQEGDYKRIALQFPDELLHVSVPIYRLLRSELEAERQIYVLADTTYGSCCVDEVAAQHVDADVVVHYGHACLSPTSRLPVIYVFGQHPVDPEKAARALASVVTKETVLLLCDVSYAYQMDRINTALKSQFQKHISLISPIIPRVAHPSPTPLVMSTTSSAPASENEAHKTTWNRWYNSASDVPVNEYTIFYVGEENLALNNLIMAHSQSNVEIWSYSPQSDSIRQESSSSKFLMRRYATVQKARDADVFGILIGTLGVASYIPMIKHVRLLLTRAGKKSYTVSVGKLNPSKLANFTEIECFVLIACPENSVIDSKEFLRPIITPFELEFALGLRAWSGNYILDFDTLLKESTSGNDSRAVEEEVSDPDQPVFSLITGQYRTRKRYGKEDDQSIVNGENGTVALRNSDGTVTRVIDSAAGEFLQGRTFRGLEPRLGQDAPSELEQGRSGIARGYGETVSNEDNHS